MADVHDGTTAPAFKERAWHLPPSKAIGNEQLFLTG